MYFAHSGKPWEPLRDHLTDVAERAAKFAKPFQAEDEARVAGLLHDLGKYSDRFTRRLDNKDGGLDHWSAGAWAALAQLRHQGLAAAFAIQGHHVGLQRLTALQDLQSAPKPFPGHLQLTELDGRLLLDRLAADGLDLRRPMSSIFDPSSGAGRVASMLDVRMLFSTLVDADYLETEAHFQRDAQGCKVHRAPGPPLGTEAALDALEARLAEVARTSQATEEVNRLRADLLAACRDAGSCAPGLFTLTAPTGAGKTLAMLAFALHHARAHKMRRIVLAVPFLSIIEQTVGVYRGLFAPVFPGEYVLEHHSLAGTRGAPGSEPDEAGRRARLLAENWDAPLVVTTSVQLLESLFANRPRACRKLHRLAGSVILLDEVQTLPPKLAAPTLAALSHLAHRYGASVVFATATQPAFDHLDAKVKPLAASGWSPREIVPQSLGLFERARRTRVEWDLAKPRSWDSIADELAGAGSALCIVNLKRHAQELTKRLRERGVHHLYHLSTNLCPAHRKRMLDEVRARLKARLPCLLVATQCVEAGVDVDFPLVLRVLGPLDAIAQAAGRCNRNGRMPEPGLVKVFLPEDEGYPPGGYAEATTVTRALYDALGEAKMDLQSTELFRGYYRRLYDLLRLDQEGLAVPKELAKALQSWDFEAAAKCYRLIENEAVNVVVPWDLEAYRSLREEIRETGHLTADWIRRARPHVVSLYRPKRDALIWAYLNPVAEAKAGEGEDDWFFLLGDDLYDRDLLGLTGPDPDGVWIA